MNRGEPQERRGNSGGIKLREWRTRGHVPARSVAELVPCSVRTLYRWENGRSMPTLPRAVRIQKITRGAVRLDEWGHTRQPRGGK